VYWGVETNFFLAVVLLYYDKIYQTVDKDGDEGSKGKEGSLAASSRSYTTNQQQETGGGYRENNAAENTQNENNSSDSSSDEMESDKEKEDDNTELTDKDRPLRGQVNIPMASDSAVVSVNCSSITGFTSSFESRNMNSCLVRFVRENLFKHVKLSRTERTYKFGNPLSIYSLQEMNIHGTEEYKELWWNGKLKKIKCTINKRRANVVCGIKNIFKGKQDNGCDREILKT
jgi:hypothetical protein